MITVKEIYVSTYDLDGLTINWVYEHLTPGITLSTATIDVQRSETDDFSEYTTIVAGLNAENYTEYTDTSVSGVISRRYNDMNYRLRFVEDNGYETISPVTWLTKPISLRAKDIIRRKNLVLGLHGRTFYTLKKKTSGTKCTECYDAIMDVATAADCTSCYGTGFVGGYYSAISFKAFATSTPDQNTINRFGEFNRGQMMMFISSYPRISVNDIIVDDLGRRWWVTKVNNIRHKGYVVSQDVLLSLVDRNDKAYSISVN